MRETPITPSVANRRHESIHQVRGWRALVLWPLAFTLRLWLRTLRIEFSPEMERLFRETSGQVIFMLWHNRFFAASEIHRRYRRHQRRLFGMVSASKDGAWLAAFFQLLDIGVVRGSAKRRGAQAALEMMAAVEAGGDFGITVDGPRGPVYATKEGGPLVAMRSGVAVVLVVPIYQRAWRIGSWDRTFIPVPFSRVRCEAAFYPQIGALEASEDRGLVAAAITRRLRELGAGTDPALGL